MSVRAVFWVLFVLLVFVLPLPLLGPFDALVPVVRFALLFGVSAAVAMAEGAAGPVPLILLLFGAHALFGLGVCAGIAWLASRGLSRLAPASRRVWVSALVVGAVAVVRSGLRHGPALEKNNNISFSVMI